MKTRCFRLFHQALYKLLYSRIKPAAVTKDVSEPVEEGNLMEHIPRERAKSSETLVKPCCKPGALL
ncbi:MAG: hypothetical protein QXQ71_05755 [Desulfurococcaceae archaeon]